MSLFELQNEMSQINSLACLLSDACDIGDETTRDLVNILYEKISNLKEKLRRQ